MQLIGEAFLLLKNTQNGKGLSRTTKDCARIFDKYNRGKLKSFLVEITAGLLKKRDDRSDSMLVDQARTGVTRRWRRSSPRRRHDSRTNTHLPHRHAIAATAHTTERTGPRQLRVERHGQVDGPRVRR